MVFRISADNAEMIRVLKQVREENEKTASSFEKLKRGMESINRIKEATMAGFSLFGVGFGLEKTMDAFEKFEKTNIRMNAMLEVNGRNVRETTAEYNRFAKEMRNVSELGLLQTKQLLMQAESFGLTGAAAERAVKSAAGLSTITGHSTEALMRITAAAEKGDLETIRMYGRLIPQLRHIQDDYKLVAEYQKLVEAGDLAMVESAGTLSHQLDVQKDKLREAQVELGNIATLLGGAVVDAATAAGKALSEVTTSKGADGKNIFAESRDEASAAQNEIMERFKASKKTKADYDEAIHKLDEEAAHIVSERHRRPYSFWNRNLAEAMGHGPEEAIYAQRKALQEMRDKAAKESPETTLRKGANLDMDRWLEKLREENKYLDVNGRLARLAKEDEAARVRLAKDRERGGDAAKAAETERELDRARAAKEGVTLAENTRDMIDRLTDEAAAVGVTATEKHLQALDRKIKNFKRDNNIDTDEAKAVLQKLQEQRGGLAGASYQAEIAKVREQILTPEQKMQRELNRINELMAHGLKLEEAQKAVELERLRILGQIAGIGAQPLYMTGAFRAQQFQQYFNPLSPFQLGAAGGGPEAVAKTVGAAGGGPEAVAKTVGEALGAGVLAGSIKAASKFGWGSGAGDAGYRPMAVGIGGAPFAESKGGWFRAPPEGEIFPPGQGPLAGLTPGRGTDDAAGSKGAGAIIQAIQLLPEQLKNLGTMIGFINIGG